MSRALFLSMSAAQATAKCDAEAVGISALEELPNRGVRLVCMSNQGAEVMRRKLKSQLMKDDTIRFKSRPRTPLW